MSDDYARGIAFVMEGPTEKVFYREFLSDLSRQCKCTFKKLPINKSGTLEYCWTNRNEKILIKINVVGTISQVTNSEKWVRNACVNKFKIPWIVFLCYDTDDSNNDISKFYQDDWKILRKRIKSLKVEKIIDLAASADIEDVILYDLEGVCKFLGISFEPEIKGRKGKAKMKYLYRQVGQTYHEGDRACDMIKELDFEKIMKESPIHLEQLKKELIN